LIDLRTLQTGRPQPGSDFEQPCGVEPPVGAGWTTERECVIQIDPDPELKPGRAFALIHREHKFGYATQMWRGCHQSVAFGEALEYQREVEVLQIAQSTVQ